MKIRVLAFASAGDALGAGEVAMEVPAGCTVAGLRPLLERDFPALRPLWARLAIAVDGHLVPSEVSAEQPLPEGAEVALLPPVSGGCGDRGDERALLVEGPIDPAALLARVTGPGRGAAVLFVGSVRDRHAGRTVEKLTYSAYHVMAREGLSRIVADLEHAHPGLRAAIAHRLGEVPVAEASVAIAVASPHRRAAYEASRLALERLKSEVPIWKREHYAGGESAWREEEPLANAAGRRLRSSP